MKIRSARMISAAGWLATGWARSLSKSLRFEYKHLGPEAPVMLAPPEPAPRYLYLMWHEYLLASLTKFSNPRISTLVSNHADGQMLAKVIRNLGLSVVFGSTQRGGTQAVREILRNVSGCRHLAITPDGPRGPRRIVQSGCIYIASRAGIMLAPLGVGYYNPWRARSWDRFAIPKPCTRVKAITRSPIFVPPDIKSDGLEHYRLLAQAELDRLTLMAERWAETNKLVELPPVTLDDVRPNLRSAS